MVPELYPLTVSAVNLPAFIKYSTEVKGFATNRVADASKRTLSDPAKFLVILKSIQDPGLRDALAGLRDSVDLMPALHYSFMVVADQATLYDVATRSPVHIISSPAVDGECFAVVAGNLQEWFLGTLACCSDDKPYNVRFLFDRVVQFFESIGLGELWYEYRKKTLPDQTFLLEHKK